MEGGGGGRGRGLVGRYSLTVYYNMELSLNSLRLSLVLKVPVASLRHNTFTIYTKDIRQLATFSILFHLNHV